MHKDFYIFRHGETDYNKEKRWQGCGIDIPLNQTGILQAQELAKHLEGKDIEHIYSSNLKRALQTAQIVAERLKIGVDVIPDLREGCFGKVEGMLKMDIAQQYAKRDAFIGFFGGVCGLVFAVPTIFMIAHLAAQIEGGIINEAKLDFFSWGLILSLPLFSALIAMLTAYYTVKRTLEKMM